MMNMTSRMSRVMNFNLVVDSYREMTNKKN